jgi:hypothetical protein
MAPAVTGTHALPLTDVEVWTVTPESRDGLPAKVLAWLRPRVDA